MAPLDFLSPLVAVGAVTAMLLISAIASPVVNVLAKSPMPGGAWRWPFLWVTGPLLSMVVTAEALRDQTQSLLPLGALCLWLTLSLLVGLPRLAFRVLRFTFTGRTAEGTGRLDSALAVLGLGAAAIGLVGALSTNPGLAGLSLLVAAVSLNFLRTPSASAPAAPRFRGLWVFGTFLVAACTPMVLAGVVVLSQDGVRAVVSHQGIPKGALVMLAAMMGLALGFIARRSEAHEAATGHAARPPAPSTAHTT